MHTRWILRAIVTVLAGLGVLSTTGCTRESLRIALAAQQRADDVQQAVLDRQHEALCILLFRDLTRRLESSGVALGDAQRAVLSDAWNERDLVEFWALQNERARALRIAGVDTKLAADQSVVDLLIKATLAKTERLEAGIAAALGYAVGQAAATSTDDAEVSPEEEGYPE